jgi:uncharacterized protein involved in exopolysaccharide biosynthesis
MIERDHKEKRQAEFTRQHTLGPEQLKKLLEDKTARARQYSLANQKRRQLCEER